MGNGVTHMANAQSRDSKNQSLTDKAEKQKRNMPKNIPAGTPEKV